MMATVAEERGRLQYRTYNGDRAWELGLAKSWAREHGFGGNHGGWIVDSDGTAVAHGWDRFWQLRRTQILDALTGELTAFRTFSDLLNAAGTYRPTILTRKRRGGWKYEALAEAYDDAQRERGDARRAHRGFGYLKEALDCYPVLQTHHLIDGEREADGRGLCGVAHLAPKHDLTPATIRYITCRRCLRAAGLSEN